MSNEFHKLDTNPTRLLNGSVVLIHLYDFIEAKQNYTNFSTKL